MPMVDLQIIQIISVLTQILKAVACEVLVSVYFVQHIYAQGTPLQNTAHYQTLISVRTLCFSVFYNNPFCFRDASELVALFGVIYSYFGLKFCIQFGLNVTAEEMIILNACENII